MTIEQIQNVPGITPLVGLNRLPGNTSCRILSKLEGYNPSGSTKDRIVRNMLIQAEHRGEISPGDTLVEATSGNTGIALATKAKVIKEGKRIGKNIEIIPYEQNVDFIDIHSEFDLWLSQMLINEKNIYPNEGS